MIKKISTENEIKTILNCFKNDFETLRDGSVSIDELAVKASLNAECYVYEENDKPIWFVLFYANDYSHKKAYISLLAVNRECRGKSVGKKIIEFAQLHSYDAGMREIWLEVKKTNATAIAFYDKMGYVRKSETETSIYMNKRLDDKNEN